MVLKKHSKEKEIAIHEVVSYEEQIADLKDATFSILAAHLQQNSDAPAYPFYLCLLLEHLAMLWYITHPGLNIYADVYLIAQVNSFLKSLNFHEFLAASPALYQSLVMIVGVYLLFQLLVLAVSAYATLRGKTGEFFKYLKKIVNYQFLLTAKTLSGPLIGFVINVLYCDPGNAYHLGEVCYDTQHLIFCVAAAVIGLVVLLEVLVFSLIYFIKNPLNPSYMGVQNRYYMLSKSIVKILMPLYFAIDPSLSLSIVYMFSITGVLGIYLFWHRLFSVHSYNQKHFYVEYFFEIVLFWMAVSNLTYYYASGATVFEEFSFLYTLFAAMLVAVLLMSIEYRCEEGFVKECLGSRIKKQNMEKFIYILINRVLYCNAAESRLVFNVYCKLLSRTYALPPEKASEEEKDHRVEIYRFLSRLIDAFLLENNSIMLKSIKCCLSCLLLLKSYGVHQSLELEEQRLSLVEEFMLYQFRKSINLYENESSDKENREFLKFYRFHEEFGRLEAYVEACSKNNAQYWEQLCESDPSLAKLRNLATLYSLYEVKITEQYEKINELVPQSIYATNLYFGFLVNSGVDVRATIKMKEKLSSILETRTKNAKISNEEINEDEEMSIITLDTIGNNLGVVLNSNSHVRELLGFEKTALLGKNITKLMPKIYTELHNAFMLNFIRSENSHQRSSTKFVTALNRHSLLVEINLSVRILNSTQSDLAIVGFMKRINAEPYRGLVMYSATNGEVLGIDENFVEMMNKRLTGKQVAQEEIRLAVLAPELNMELLEKELEQETLLEVGSSLEEEGDLEVQKKIRVHLKKLKIYEGVKLGFLEIVDLSHFQTANKKLLTDISSKIANLATKHQLRQQRSDSLERSMETAVRNNRRKLTEDLSINLSQSQRALNESAIDGLNRELPTARRLQEYIKVRESSRLAWMLKLIYGVCILGCTSAALYTYFSHEQFLNDKQQVYLIMNQTLSMPYYEAEINTYVCKIWNIHTMNYCGLDYSSYFQQLYGFLVDLKNTFSQLTTTISNVDYALEYNEMNFYNFTFSEGVNNTLTQVVRNETYADALSNYITAANIFTQYSLNNSTSNQRTVLQIEALFVQENGEFLLPSIGISAADKYLSFYLDSFAAELTRMIVIKAVLMVLIIVCFVCIVVLGHFLNRINLEVVEIYSNLRLVDICELQSKYDRFLEQKGFRVNSKQRTSSVIKFAPNKPVKDAIKQEPAAHSKKERRVSEKPQPLTTEEEPLNMKTNESRLFTYEDSQVEVEPNANIEGEQALLRGKEQVATAKIEEERSNTKIVTALLTFFIIFGALLVISYLLVSSNAHQLEDYINRLSIIGETKKTLNLIDYYSLRIIQNNSDAETKKLLMGEIQSFYELTQEGYIYLGDPSPILKNTYSFVQTIQQWLTVPNITSQGILIANYTYLDDGLQQTIRDINSLDFTTYYPQYEEEISNGNQNELIFTVLLIACMCLAVFFMHSLYLGPMRAQGKHSLNMLRILPSWALQRNPKALKIIAA